MAFLLLMLLIGYFKQVFVANEDIKPSRFLRCQPIFCSLLMVSVGVLALKRTNLHLLDAVGVKINGQYHIVQKLLPDIKEFSDYFSFQQDSAAAHRAQETVDLLKRLTPDFIPPSL